MADFIDIDPLIYTHHKILEDSAKSIRQMQQRRNPAMKEVVKAEVLELLTLALSIKGK